MKILGSVRFRITVAATLVFALALGVAAVMLVGTVRSSLRDKARSESRDALAEYTRRIKNGEEPTDLPPLRFSGVVYVQVLDERGRVVGGTGLGVLTEALVRPDGTRRSVLVSPSGESMVFSEQVSAPTGRYTVVAASPLDAVRRSVDALSHSLWIAVPLLVLLVGIVAWYVTGRALRPVEAIRAEVEAITATSLDRRVPEPRSHDEVARLAATMNQMLDRLEDASARQRQFVSDASHELRSPVAAIRTTGEVALAHPDRADWPRVVERMLDEDGRMEQIVAELVVLAREDEAATALPATEVDLDEIVLEEAARPAGAIVVRTDRVSAGRVRGSAELLTRMVRNLVDNATRHATGTVALSLRTEASTVVLVVDDDGPGVAPEDRERVFERFTRLDEGRARDQGGLGLGLAMVRSIVAQHGGSVTVGTATDTTPAPGLGGARFEVRLPAADAPPEPVADLVGDEV
jgi:signal transduction histidine kinase